MRETGIMSLDRVSTRIWHCSDTETLKCSGLLLNGSALGFARQEMLANSIKCLPTTAIHQVSHGRPSLHHVPLDLYSRHSKIWNYFPTDSRIPLAFRLEW